MGEYINPTIEDFDDDALQDIAEEHEPEKNDYYFKESVYFAFIDVLGFKKAFDDNRQNYDIIKKDNYFADRFKNVFIYYFNLMDSAKFMKGKHSYAGQTSDSLYFYTTRVDFLIEFLGIFSHLNAYAMTQNVFFRGGIAKGNIFYRQDYQFYGESVIYAYLLESEISKKPIIVFDEKTYEEIKSTISYADKIIDQDSRGRHYLKPFAYREKEFILKVDHPFVKTIDEDKLYEVIKQNKSRFEYDNNNYGKYVFLLNEYKNVFGIK